MQSLFVRLALCWSLAVALTQPVFAAVYARRDAKVVSVSQTVGSSASGLQNLLTIDIGMAGQLRGAAALSKGSTRLSDRGAFSFPGLPVVDFSSKTKTECRPFYGPTKGYDGIDVDGGDGCQTVGLSEADITTAADGMIASHSAVIVASLNSLMKANQAVTGIFTFEQDLGTSTLSGQRRLVWSAILDPNGRVMFGQSKIVSTKQFYLYLTYTPLAVASGLPQSWAYPNGGILTWTLVNSKLQALQAPNTIDTGGYFDEPDGVIGNEAKLKCLMDSTTSGCSQSYPDVVTLLAQSGASGAFVDYVHAVNAVYDNVEAPLGSGQYTSIAELMLTVPTREVVTTFDLTCQIKTYTYSNSGTYKFNLTHAMTRYFIDRIHPGFTAVANMAKTVVSPDQSYSMSLSVSDSELPSLPNLYIDPFLQEGPLLSVGYLPAGSSLAPVDYLPPPACTPVAAPTMPTTPTGP